MKRLVTRHEKDRKAKRNQLFVGVALVLLMVISTIGFALQTGPNNSGSGSETSNTHTYNGFEFSYLNGFWVLGNFVFRYKPSETPELGEGLKDATYYQGKPAYIYSENKEAENEIKLNLRQISERMQSACLKGAVLECGEDLILKTCEDNFIIIKNNTQREIRQENNCVFIEGPNEELVKLADQFLFKILKVK